MDQDCEPVILGTISECVHLLTSCYDLDLAPTAVLEVARKLIHAERLLGTQPPSWYRGTKERMFWLQPLHEYPPEDDDDNEDEPDDPEESDNDDPKFDRYNRSVPPLDRDAEDVRNVTRDPPG